MNNIITERLLKTAILHLKITLHYRTVRGATVGDTFMSVIQTCRANEVNALDYIVAVVQNRSAVHADPGRWLPWNYQAALAGPAPPT